MKIKSLMALTGFLKTNVNRFLIVLLLQGGVLLTSSDLCAQTEEPEAFCPLIGIDIGMQMDKSFLDHFSNETDPESEAWDFISGVINKASTVWGIVEPNVFINPTWSAQEVYENDYLYDSDLTAWCDNIMENWQVNRPCIRKDVIVYFTGRNTGYNGYTALNISGKLCYDFNDKTGRRCILICPDVEANWNIDKTGFTLAHEIGHLLGLLRHEDDPILGGGCNQDCDDPLFMCSGNNESTDLSICMNNKLNALLTDNVSGRCDCLGEEIFDNQAADCERCYPIVTDVVVDNIHPVKGCVVGREKVTVTATVRGGCSGNDLVTIRALVKSSEFKIRLDENDNIVSNYFTHSRLLANGQIELYALVDPENPGSPEKKIALELEDVEEVTFDILFDADAGDISDYIPTGVYLQTVDALGTVTVLGSNPIEPYYSVEPDPGQPFYQIIDPAFDYYGTEIMPYRYFHVIGNVELSYETHNLVSPPPDGPPDDYFFVPGQALTDEVTRYTLDNFHFLMSTGSKVHLEADTDVRLRHSTFEGCETMWEGIEADGGSYLTSSNTLIQDAQYGMRAKGPGMFRITKTTFRNNNFGVYGAFTASSGFPNMSLRGNTFENTAALKSIYSGQSPVPVGQKGYAGIYFDKLPAAIIDNSGVDSPANNLFQGLHNGIVAKNSNIMVRNSVFKGMLWTGASLAAYPVNLAGNGVFCTQGTLRQSGLGSESGSPLSFENCHAGVRAAFSTIDISQNRMQGVDYGVRSANLAPMKYFKVQNNYIQAKDVGIALHQYVEVPGGSTVRENHIRMDNNANGTGIKIGGNSLTSTHYGGDVFDNTVVMENAANGIQVNIANRLNVHNNRVYMEDSESNYAGIQVNGGNKNAILCNYAEGTLSSENGTGGPGGESFLNIRAYQNMHAPATEWGCNTLSGTGIGMEIAGAADMNDIRGNTFAGVNTGLQLGLAPNIGDVFTGPQTHRGNIWDDEYLMTGATYLGNPFQVVLSEFIVDPSYTVSGITSAYLPNEIEGPSIWFQTDDDDDATFECDNTQQTGYPGNCQPITFIPLQRLQTEKAIATGQLPAEYFGPALKWTGRRHLYRRLMEDGNPYPTDTDITTFLTGTDTAAVRAFGILELDLRDAFDISSQDSIDLLSYQKRMGQYMDDFITADSLLQDTTLSHSDVMKTIPDYEPLLQDMQDYFSGHRILLDTLVNRRTAHRSKLLADNGFLPDTAVYQANAKVVHALFTEHFMDYDIVLDSLERVTLAAIASQCPLEGGEAVLVARVMLDAVLKTPVFYNDVLLCEQTEEEERISQKPSSVGQCSVSPNPASSMLTLRYEFPPDSPSGHFILRNTLGKICTDIQLDARISVTEVSLEHLPNGIYSWEYRDTKTLLASGKVVVIH